jgi:uncharacterized protein (TIGR00255 family)
MIRSMTAFARSEEQYDGWMITWELRSVNHRFLDITLRLPETLRSLEGALREKTTAAVSRGKVEGSLKFQSKVGGTANITLNLPFVDHLLAVAKELQTRMNADTGPKLSDILRWPGVIAEAEPDLEQLTTAVSTGLDQALAELVATRCREGERIQQMILQRCHGIKSLVQQVRARRPEVRSKLREKWLARLSELSVEPDLDRLEQEMAILAQRLDVDEELDRLDAHISEIDDVLERSEPVGRRLDFLMQELHRETNTLAAKSGDAETTRITVELKVLIEQMREQIQNVE